MDGYLGYRRYSPGSITDFDAMTPSLQLLPKGEVARLEFETIDSSSSEVLAASEDNDLDFLVMPLRMAVTALDSIVLGLTSLKFIVSRHKHTM